MIFVTGGTGLVGAHLLYELILAEKKVKALKRETSNLNQVVKTFSYYSENPNQLFEKIEWVDGDILDYFTLEKLLAGVTEIYHCAAIVSFQLKERGKMISNNVEGTANLVNAALENGVKKICHVSSIAALGRLQNGLLINEETNWIPSKRISGYSESKFFSEAEIWRGIEEGLDAVIVNPSIILGPSNWEAGSSKLFKTIWDGLKFYTKGVTGFVDIKDVVRAMIMLMDKSNFDSCKNQRFLLNSENLSYQSVFNQIAKELDKPKPKIFASNFILGIVWRVVTFASWIAGKPTMISRDSVANSNAINNFDGSKITRTLVFKYQSISNSIKKAAGFLKKDMAKYSAN
ncbi:MAG: NAD-dependent epimerase/dehydratase family protein [Prolixibacteraceae bacterium]|jgi:dihydroflavonol-4-reductase|nr:NAD-dependent epimerase/dehydratase family protein [Prolixibacteraceae bacterium]MBT6764291.1 NAD-dependent epimerase/dehydratase family protein [Prolixibacteraceae bacterium]MBT7000044.1 NAD-dependent epimerase/dehydratase family protein [Prolixibacteraceae bacterium]MBT7394833.1 NAD-dependent epimerase/dehydratase family protein [Prolixibacteraceae bacterium]